MVLKKPPYTHEWLCRRLVEASPDAIIFTDREGVIRLWNSGAQAIFGYQAAEALGQTLDLIIPEKLRARHQEGYLKAMATGVTKYGRELLAVPGLRKDGTRISLEFNIALIRAEEGVILGAAAIIREVSARWEKEKEMKQRLAALEARVAKLAKVGNQV